MKMIFLYVLFLSLGIPACFKINEKVPPLKARFFLENRLPTPLQKTVSQTLEVSKINITTDSQALILETDLINVELVKVELGLCLLFQIDRSLVNQLYTLSINEKGSRIVFIYNGRTIGSTILSNPIADGKLYMFLEISDRELPEIVADLKAFTSLKNKPSS